MAIQLRASPSPSPSAAPGTPKRERVLRPQSSFGTDDKAAKRRRHNADEEAFVGKAIKQEQEQQQVVAVCRDFLGASDWDWNGTEEFDKHGVPAATRLRLLPFIHTWGQARIAQALGLWTFLGDGCNRPVSVSNLQVWGPPGTGKTRMVFNFLTEFGIRHIRLNCACFTSVGELHARIAEELRLAALSGASSSRSIPAKDLKELQQRPRMGRQIRAIDRLEASIRLPLEYLTRRDEDNPDRPLKVVIVLDQAQELPRLGIDALDHLVALPEVLKMGSRLSILTIGRLPLSSLGLLPARDPPAVAFQPYAEAEATAILQRTLSKLSADVSASDLKTLCGSGLMKFAAPYVGRNLHHLERIGEDLLSGRPGQLPIERNANMVVLQQRIQEEVQRRVGLCDLSGLLDAGEAAMPATTAAMRGMTKAEKRLLLSAYLGSRIDKDDDMQLFLPEGKRRKRNKGAVTKGNDDDLPAYVRAPRPVPLARVLAIYHKLARQPLLVGPTLIEHLTNLREAGFVRFAGEHCIEREPKVFCRVELPFVRACANELDIDLAEYLCK